MAAPEEFIEINDFSPGIFSDIHAGLDTARFPGPAADTVRGFKPGNGAATVENTYSCRVDKTGALIPLPQAFSSSHSTEGIPTNLYTTANRPAAAPAAFLLDVEVSPPRWYDLVFNNATEVSSVYCLWGFFYAPAGDGVANNYYAYVLGREYRIGAFYQNVYDYLFSRSTNRYTNTDTKFGFPAGSLANSRLDHLSDPDTISANGIKFDVSKTTPVMVGVVSFRHRNNPDIIGLQQGAIGATELAWLTDYYPPPGGVAPVKKPTVYSPTTFALGVNGRFNACVIGMSVGTDGYDIGAAHPTDEWSFHEKDDFEITAEKNSPYAPYMVVAHQGRIVMPDMTGLRDFLVALENNPAAAGSLSMFFTDDILWYSRWGQPIGDVYVSGVEYMRGYIPLQVAEDQVSQIGVVGVITGDELFIVKARGGGALVRGDLDNPTVRRLPHIEPTHGIVSKGAQTPIGFVYGTKTGVFVFDGGDSTRKLSEQLDGWFWNPYTETDINFNGSYGRFAYWNGMIFVPNNYVYDVDTGSWWRLPYSDTVNTWKYNCYVPSNGDQLWAFPYKVGSQSVASRPVFHAFNVDLLATYYSWQSQPLVETRGRRVSFQDVRIVCSAKSNSQFVVTLKGYSETGANTATTTVTLTCPANKNPQILRKDITPNFVAEYVQVRVEATGDPEADAPYAAPKLHSLRLGIRPRQTTPRAG